MTTQDTSDPAFPAFPETSRGHASAHKGMTLRDHYAGLAMQAMVTSEFLGYDANDAAKRWAGQAYVVADAMLAARSAR